MYFKLFLTGLSMISFLDNQTYNSYFDLRVIDPTYSTLPMDRHQFKPDTLVDPININRLKALEFLTTTFGVIPYAESAKLCPVKSPEFFGFYHLINKQTSKQFGILKVYCTEKPENWQYDTKNETFVAIELYGNDIKAWDQEFIGMTKEVAEIHGFPVSLFKRTNDLR